jgi:peptidyl-prolyl cis-trans isomerase C
MKKFTYALVAVGALVSASAVLAKDEVVARVNGKDITMSEVKQLEAALPKEVAERAESKEQLTGEVVNQLIDLKVLTDAALASGIEKSKEFQEALKKATENLMVQAFIQQQLSSKVNDQAVEKEYNDLKEKFQKEVKNKKEVKVRHMLFKDQASAKAALLRLEKGEDFQKVARELSEDKQSAQDGGDLGYILEGAVPDFEKPLADLKPGQHSKEPTKSQFGCHVFKVDDRRPAKAPKFEDVKQQLAGRVQQKAVLELVKRLRDKATVENLYAADKKDAGAKADTKKDEKKEEKK